VMVYQLLTVMKKTNIKIEITYAVKDQLKNMIKDLYPSQIHFFDKFWKNIKTKKITMAAFQNFLFYCYQNKKNIYDEINYFLQLLDSTSNNYSHMFA